MGETAESATMSSGYNSAGMVGTPNANGNSSLRLRHPSAGAPLSSIATGHRAPPAGAAPPSAPLPPKTYARQQQLQSQWSSESTGSVTLDASSYAGYEQQAGAMAGGGMHISEAAWPHVSGGALQSLRVQVKQEPHLNGDVYSVGPLSAGAGLPRGHQQQAGGHGAKYAPPSQIYQYSPRPLPGAAGFPMAHHPDCNPAYCRCFPTMVSPAQRAIQRSDSQASASSATGTPPQSAGLNAPPSGFHFGIEQTGAGVGAGGAGAPPLAQFNPSNSDAPQQQQQQQLMAAQMAFLSQIPLYLRGFQNQHGVPVTSAQLRSSNLLAFSEQPGLQSAASAGSRRESQVNAPKPGDLQMDLDGAAVKSDASLNAFPYHPFRAQAADATTRQLPLSSYNPANASAGGAPAGNPFSLALGMPMSPFGSMLSEMARLGGQQAPMQLAVTSSPVGTRLPPDTSAAAFSSLLSLPMPLDGLSIRGGSSPAISCSLSSSSASTSNAQLALTPQLAINGQSAAAQAGGGGELSILAAANSGAQSVLQQILTTEPDPAIINKFLTTEILLNDVLMHVPLESAHDDSPEWRSRLVSELCRIFEQLLYDSVEWARQSVFFKELCVREPTINTRYLNTLLRLRLCSGRCPIARVIAICRISRAHCKHDHALTRLRVRCKWRTLSAYHYH